MVETQNERDKLMFRIRVRIDPDRLRGRAESVRSGLPGVAYVRTDPARRMAAVSCNRCHAAMSDAQAHAGRCAWTMSPSATASLSRSTT